MFSMISMADLSEIVSLGLSSTEKGYKMKAFDNYKTRKEKVMNEIYKVYSKNELLKLRESNSSDNHKERIEKKLLPKTAYLKYFDPRSIKFRNELDKDYGFLSNRYKSRFWINGVHWPSVEHLYYASMFDRNSNAFRLILDCEDPSCVKPIAQECIDSGIDVLSDFEKIEDQVVYNGIFAKFLENPDLRSKLGLTGTAPIVYINERSDYWGIGRDGRGRNRLGDLLVQVRTKFQSNVV